MYYAPLAKLLFWGKVVVAKPGPEVIKKAFSMLNSAEQEILNAHKYKNRKKFSTFLGSYKLLMLFFLFINVKMPTIVGILIFMNRKNFMLNCVEHEKQFYNLGPGKFPKIFFLSGKKTSKTNTS